MSNKTIAFVPTMGALHNGHISLIKKAASFSDIVAASIFVNPKQFNSQEDYKKYPKTFDEDIKKLATQNVDFVFAPNEDEIYSPKNRNYIFAKPKSALDFEGKFRQGHFEGMLEIVSILFNLIRPDIAFFGKKDAQQIAVIRETLIDGLKFPIKLIECETVRDGSGLALSSRNARLDANGIKTAQNIYQALLYIKNSFLEGLSLDNALEGAKNLLKGIKIDYLDIVNKNFQKVSAWSGYKSGDIKAVFAGYVDGVRLIDNLDL